MWVGPAFRPNPHRSRQREAWQREARRSRAVQRPDTASRSGGLAVARYALLLRAVNLGPHNRVSMPDLRRLLGERGYEDVATYLASGNAVVTSADDADAVGRDVADALRDEFGLDTPVLVRDHAELAAIVAGNP